jgi:hypothetical protein
VRSDDEYFKFTGWGDAIMGIDGCVYCWPPSEGGHILKYDPHIDLSSIIGIDFGDEIEKKWLGGAVASDGIIYCMPWKASRVLAIDPFRDFKKNLKSHME